MGHNIVPDGGGSSYRSVKQNSPGLRKTYCTPSRRLELASCFKEVEAELIAEKKEKKRIKEEKKKWKKKPESSFHKTIRLGLNCFHFRIRASSQIDIAVIKSFSIFFQFFIFFSIFLF